MILLHSPPLISPFNLHGGRRCIQNRTVHSVTIAKLKRKLGRCSDSPPASIESSSGPRETLTRDPLCSPSYCSCGRRRLIGAICTSFLPIPLFSASAAQPDPAAMLNQVHPPRPDWYEEFYASVMATGMKSYEVEIAGYKSQLFADLKKGRAETVLEIGIGTGPNLKYYAGNKGIRVYGIDPNRKMEKYVQAAATLAGLPPTNFEFKQAVAEAIPLDNASVDAVVGTLVLCSVKNVDMALQEIMRVLKPGGTYQFVEHVAAEDGTILRFIQGVLDPLQQTVADGCHLTRKTGKLISEAGFSNVNINTAFVSNASFINPHVFGVACK